MADIGDRDMDGEGAPVINGGLLDPRAFPSPWPPSPAPEPQTASPSPDQDLHAQVLQDILAAQAKLPPIGGQSGNDGADYGGDWLERSPPLIKRGLDTDAHAEVLQDILNAQAKLPPLQMPQDNNAMVVNGQRYSVLKAGTFDPARSYGQTAMPNADTMAAGITGAGTVAVPYGTAEKMAYVIPFPSAPNAADANPLTGLVDTLRTQPMVFMPSAGVTTGSSGDGSTAKGRPPAGVMAIEHGHIDDGPTDPFGQPYASDGMVDSPADNGGYGDADSLRFSIPTATVSHGQVGWHVLDNGQLKYLYPPGSMTPMQIQEMQRNLDREQQNFLRPK